MSKWQIMYLYICIYKYGNFKDKMDSKAHNLHIPLIEVLEFIHRVSILNRVTMKSIHLCKTMYSNELFGYFEFVDSYSSIVTHFVRIPVWRDLGDQCGFIG